MTLPSASGPRDPRPIPATAGIGLRARHHTEIPLSLPAVGWFEAHCENYFGRGGPARRALAQVREHYPLSLHGVGLSLGSTDPLDRSHLDELRGLIRDFEPALVSEHLSWGSTGGIHFNDLWPLPYTGEALRHMTRRVAELQDLLDRQILIENVSSYLNFTGPEMTEWDFVAQLAQESGCALLLDVNNIYVSAMNHGFDAREYLAAIPAGSVGEIHLAGHSIQQVGEREIRIDTHGSSVCAAVWDLYRCALQRFGTVPTLIEWDTDVPELEVLVAEAHHADRYLKRHHAIAA